MPTEAVCIRITTRTRWPDGVCSTCPADVKRLYTVVLGGVAADLCPACLKVLSEKADHYAALAGRSK